MEHFWLKKCIENCLFLTRCACFINIQYYCSIECVSQSYCVVDNMLTQISRDFITHRSLDNQTVSLWWCFNYINKKRNLYRNVVFVDSEEETCSTGWFLIFISVYLQIVAGVFSETMFLNELRKYRDQKVGQI